MTGNRDLKSSQHIVAMMVTLGAAAMLIAGQTPYRVLAMIADLLTYKGEKNGPAYGPALPVMAYIGLAGACAFAAGLVLAIWHSRRGKLSRHWPYGLAAMALMGAVALLATGNLRLMSAFRRLAAAEDVYAEAYLLAIKGADLCFWLGYGCLLLGAATTFWAARFGPTDGPSRFAGGIAAFISAICSGLMICLAYVWQASSTAQFDHLITNESGIKPDGLAEAVSGVILSEFLVIFGLIGMSISLLICALARKPDQKPADGERG